MTRRDDLPDPEAELEAALRRKLKDLENEEVPERLVALARELQALLRKREGDDKE